MMRTATADLRASQMDDCSSKTGQNSVESWVVRSVGTAVGKMVESSAASTADYSAGWTVDHSVDRMADLKDA